MNGTYQVLSRPGARVRATATATASRLELLHGFEVSSGESIVSLPHAAERVVAFLALHETPLRRAYVAGSLWLEVDDERAAASLRSALWRSRRRGIPIVETRNGCISLGSHLDVDVRRIEARAKRILEGNGAARRADVDELALAGELLPGWYDEWVLVEREHLRHLRLRALERACESLTAAGCFVDAAEAGLAAVACEPLRESAHRALVKLHLAEGNAAEAVRQYKRFARLLNAELGCLPSQQMLELITDSGIQIP
jgi:DNA-binding SARP family transcriptional activator